MAQRSCLRYPSARRADVVDDYFGTRVADPFRWMEDLESPELKQWIDAQNGVAFEYLDALPQRDALRARITELWNYPRVTTPRYEGRNELIVKDLLDPLAPELDAPARPLYLGHTASYKPLGVVNGTLYLLTDRDAPNKKVVAVPVDRPDPSNWRTIVPETQDAIEHAQLVDGTIAVTRLVDVAGDACFHNLDGTVAGRVATPGLGSITGPFGRCERPEIFYTFTSTLCPETVSVSTSPPATALRSTHRR